MDVLNEPGSNVVMVTKTTTTALRQNRLVQYTRQQLLTIREIVNERRNAFQLPRATRNAAISFGIATTATHECCVVNTSDSVNDTSDVLRHKSQYSRDRESVTQRRADECLAKPLGAQLIMIPPDAHAYTITRSSDPNIAQADDRYKPEVAKLLSMRKAAWKQQQQPEMHTTNNPKPETGHQFRTNYKRSRSENGPDVNDDYQSSNQSIPYRSRVQTNPDLNHEDVIMRRNKSPTKPRSWRRSLHSADMSDYNTSGNNDNEVTTTVTEQRPRSVIMNHEQWEKLPFYDPMNNTGSGNTGTDANRKFDTTPEVTSYMSRNTAHGEPMQRRLNPLAVPFQMDLPNKEIQSSNQFFNYDSHMDANYSSASDKRVAVHADQINDDAVPQFVVIDTSKPTYAPEVKRGPEIQQRQEVQQPEVDARNFHRFIPRGNTSHSTTSNNPPLVPRDNIDLVQGQGQDHLKGEGQSELNKRQSGTRRSGVQRLRSLHEKKDNPITETKNEKPNYFCDLESVYSRYHPDDHVVQGHIQADDTSRDQSMIKPEVQDATDLTRTRNSYFQLKQQHKGNNIRRSKSMKEKSSSPEVNNSEGSDKSEDISSSSRRVHRRSLSRNEQEHYEHKSDINISSEKSEKTACTVLTNRSKRSPEADDNNKKQRGRGRGQIRGQSQVKGQIQKQFQGQNRSIDTAQLANEFRDRLTLENEAKQVSKYQQQQQQQQSESNKRQKKSATKRFEFGMHISDQTSAVASKAQASSASINPPSASNGKSQIAATKKGTDPWSNFKNIDPSFFANSTANPIFVGKTNNDKPPVDIHENEKRSYHRGSKPTKHLQNNDYFPATSQARIVVNYLADDSSRTVTTTREDKPTRAARNALRRRRQRDKKRIPSADDTHAQYASQDT